MRIAAAIRLYSSAPKDRPMPGPNSSKGGSTPPSKGGETLPYMMDLEPGAYIPIGDVFAVQFTGLALNVKEKALQQAVVEALDGLIADGSYRVLLAKWKLADYGVEKATINAGQ
jgi:polar amino acid transport system substrate-binding protein